MVGEMLAELRPAFFFAGVVDVLSGLFLRHLSSIFLFLNN